MATPEAQLLLQQGPFLSEGGIQTTLIYKNNHPLRDFATFEMLHDPAHDTLLSSIHRTFADVAIKHQLPLILDMDTWRASKNWYDQLNTPQAHRASTHKLAFDHLDQIKSYIGQKTDHGVKVIIHGVIGPRKDAYINDAVLTLEQAREYHRTQLKEFKQLGLGLVAAYTLTTSTEALGIALEAKQLGLPFFISFTLDTDGNLPSGETLKQSIERVDRETDGSPLFYLINCVHPKYVKKLLEREGGNWTQRLGGIRANASVKSHAELDNSTELDEGVPEELAEELIGLMKYLPRMKIVGGCCGTGSKHCEEVAKLLNK